MLLPFPLFNYTIYALPFFIDEFKVPTAASFVANTPLEAPLIPTFNSALTGAADPGIVYKANRPAFSKTLLKSPYEIAYIKSLPSPKIGQAFDPKSKLHVEFYPNYFPLVGFSTIRNGHYAP